MVSAGNKRLVITITCKAETVASEKRTEDFDVNLILFAEFLIKLRADCFNGILALDHFVVFFRQDFFEIRCRDLEFFLRQALACMAFLELFLRLFMFSCQSSELGGGFLEFLLVRFSYSQHAT